jgi:hypothetical protein
MQRWSMSTVLSLGNYLIHVQYHNGKQQNTGQYIYKFTRAS